MARKAKQPRGKKMNPTFFVFCEGKTEAAYVDLLRRNFRVPVEIIARVSDSNISQPYIDRCRRDRFTTPEDKTFLMFDLDVPGMLEHLKKIKEATLLLSNPCIEYWFLLHYNLFQGPMHRNRYAEKLSGLLGMPYSKEAGFASQLFRVLAGKQDQAIRNAKAIMRQMGNVPPAQAESSTTVHLLVEELNKYI